MAELKITRGRSTAWSPCIWFCSMWGSTQCRGTAEWFGTRSAPGARQVDYCCVRTNIRQSHWGASLLLFLSFRKRDLKITP